jgi:hypothetical protein
MIFFLYIKEFVQPLDAKLRYLPLSSLVISSLRSCMDNLQKGKSLHDNGDCTVLQRRLTH